VLELAVATADRLLPAVAALAGVALTLVGAWLTERRRWRRERESAAEERRLEVRQATRLVEQELCEAEQLIAAAARAGCYRPGIRASMTAWTVWRPYLARHLGVADWRGVSMAFDAIRDLNELLDARQADEDGPLLIDDGHLLRDRWDAVRNASWILRGEAEEGESVHRWLDESEKLAARLFNVPAESEHSTQASRQCLWPSFVAATGGMMLTSAPAHDPAIPCP